MHMLRILTTTIAKAMGMAIAILMATSVAQALPNFNATFGWAPSGTITYTTVPPGGSLGSATSITFPSFELVNGIDPTYLANPNNFFWNGSTPPLQPGETFSLISQVTMTPLTLTLSGINASPTPFPISSFVTFASTLVGTGTNPPNRYAFDMVSLSKSSSGPGNLSLQGLGTLRDTGGTYANTQAFFSMSCTQTSGGGTVNCSFTLSSPPAVTVSCQDIFPTGGGINVVATGTPAGLGTMAISNIVVTKSSGSGSCFLQNSIGPGGTSNGCALNLATNEATCEFRKTPPASCQGSYDATYSVGTGTVVTVTCDPILGDIQLNTGSNVTQTYTAVSARDHYLDIDNSAPGFRTLQVLVNGASYKAFKLQDKQLESIDLASVLQPDQQDNSNPPKTVGVNTLTLIGSGPTGAKAAILLADVPLTDSSSPETVKFLQQALASGDTWSPPEDNVENNSAQQVALVSQQQIRLQLATALDLSRAINPSLYKVSINDNPSPVAPLQVVGALSPQGTTTTLTLTLSPATLRIGDKVQVSWDQLVNAQRQAISGQVDLVAK